MTTPLINSSFLWTMYMIFSFCFLLTNRNDNMDDDFMPPFFPVSSVTGQGIDNLIHFLSQLSCLNHPSMTPSPSPLSSTSNLFESLNDKHQKYQQFVDWNNISNKKSNQSTRIFSKIIERINLMKQQQSYNGTLVWINQVFTQIPGVLNPVIVGRVQFGQLFNYQILWLGPDQFGDFYPVQIVSLMHHRQLHEIVYAGQSVSMEVYFLPKSWNTMNEKQRQLILHNISSSITSSPASYSAINHCKKSLTSLFDNDVEHTNENEEIIPHDHNHDVNSLSVTSSSSSSSSSSSTTANTTTAVDIYQFYSPIKIRRGMILLTYPMLLSTYNTVSSPAAPSDRIDNTTAAATALSPQPSPSWHEQSSSLLLTGNQHHDSIQFTVVWTVKLQLMPRRLPIVSFKLGNPPVILTPIPLIGQRVNIYAGCICQTGIILESNTDNDENHSSSKYQQCESEQKSTTATNTTNHDDGSDVSNKTHLNNPTYILLRFTRHPELVEIGRQFILTWNGNLKAIGYAIELIDPVKQQQQYYHCTLNDTTNTTTDTTNNTTNTSSTSSTAIAINDSMSNTTTTTIDSTICWKNYYKQNYSMSFNEKDHHPNDDDCWSFDCSNNTSSGGGGTLFKYQPNSINAFNDQCSNLSSSLPSATTTTTLASMMECYEELSNRENTDMMNEHFLNKVTSSSSMMRMMNSLSNMESMRQDHNNVDIDHNNTNNIEDNINAETMSSVTSTTTTTSTLSNHKNKTKRRRHRHRGHHRHKLKKQQHS
ncbi:unnamed protein product [Schistosoma turkestanicum]|nr:unnamed protein product [Schistosoma turkestanicum]